MLRSPVQKTALGARRPFLTRWNEKGTLQEVLRLLFEHLYDIGFRFGQLLLHHAGE